MRTLLSRRTLVVLLASGALAAIVWLIVAGSDVERHMYIPRVLCMAQTPPAYSGICGKMSTKLKEGKLKVTGVRTH